jgi:hypothetical protein
MIITTLLLPLGHISFTIGSGSGSISPPILAVFRSIWCVFAFLYRPVMKSPEGVFIVGFRSNQVHGVQDCVETTLKARDGPHHTVSKWALFCALLRPRWLLLQLLYFVKKWRDKKFGSFDVRKILESPKYAKTRKSASHC